MTLNSDEGNGDCLHIVVTGRVQGVGFRAFTVSEARALGITGWVRNSPDGHSVEILAQGDPESLDQLLARLKQGPPSARVDGIQHSMRTRSERFSDFSITH